MLKKLTLILTLLLAGNAQISLFAVSSSPAFAVEQSGLQGFVQDDQDGGSSEPAPEKGAKEVADEEAEGFWSSYSGMVITFGPLILGLVGIGLLVLFRKINEAREKKKKSL